MSFTFVCRMHGLLGYLPADLLETSLFDCQHGADSERLMATFKSGKCSPSTLATFALQLANVKLITLMYKLLRLQTKLSLLSVSFSVSVSRSLSLLTSCRVSPACPAVCWLAYCI